MAGITDLSGNITSGPQSVSDTTFPTMQSSAALHTSPSPKPWQVCTGVLGRTLASPAVYVTLDGVGALATVTHANFLYFRSNGIVRLRITSVDALSTLISEEDVNGLKIIEKPENAAITLIEAKGSATFEYLAQGNS
jgi:hypothetical protein